ncbi:hypothetical protein SAMN02745166_02196 [Prosthecobacter debontii]|uniref:Uncharacterized protein n=1 Tax=Prosthecobacter debontii TaxID=48467 RepID=A0A1T4XYS3_9BACT|nr:hypothetical protein [Prosthecobacter debontii]SKA94700.1 hypothetical protein SAMN02745166_02196 [Prosthecobacter debontii]
MSEIRRLDIPTFDLDNQRSPAALALDGFCGYLNSLASSLTNLAECDEDTLAAVQKILSRHADDLTPEAPSPSLPPDQNVLIQGNVSFSQSLPEDSPPPTEAPEPLSLRFAQSIRNAIQALKKPLPAAPREAIRIISEILVEEAQNQGLVIDVPFKKIPCKAGNQEHEVWFDLEAERPTVWKITKASKWGLVAGQPRPANAIDYLDRLYLFTEIFGMPWDFQGIWIDPQGLPRIVSTQPYMPGKPATEDEIEEYLKDLGFTEIDIPELGTFWKHEETDVIVGDAYTDNFVVLETGRVVPIDLSIAICLPQNQLLQSP